VSTLRRAAACSYGAGAADVVVARRSVRAPVVAVDHRRELWMDQPRPHRNLGIEVLLIATVTGHERDDDVRVTALRADEGLGVGLAPVDLI
jgi:hypothetical protein